METPETNRERDGTSARYIDKQSAGTRQTIYRSASSFPSLHAMANLGHSELFLEYTLTTRQSLGSCELTVHFWRMEAWTGMQIRQSGARDGPMCNRRLVEVTVAHQCRKIVFNVLVRPCFSFIHSDRLAVPCNPQSRQTV